MKERGKITLHVWVSTNIYWVTGSITLGYSVLVLSSKYSSIISNSIPLSHSHRRPRGLDLKINPSRHSPLLWPSEQFDSPSYIEHHLCARHYAGPGDTHSPLPQGAGQTSISRLTLPLPTRKRGSGMFWLTQKVEKHMQNLLMVGQI